MNSNLFDSVCNELYQKALSIEKQWANQIRMINPNWTGSDQDIIHNFFTMLLNQVPEKNRKLSIQNGKEIITANIYNGYQLKSIKYQTSEGHDLTLSSARLKIVSDLFKTEAKERHENMSSNFLENDNFFKLVAGWVWEDFAEDLLSQAVDSFGGELYSTKDSEGVERWGFTKSPYVLNARSSKKKDMSINFNIELEDDSKPIALSIDVKRNLDYFHIGDKTYNPIQLQKILTDSLNLIDFLKTEIIKGKMEETYPVFLSLSSGTDTLLSSEILSNPKNFDLRDTSGFPSNTEISIMAQKILDWIADNNSKMSITSKNVKEVALKVGAKMVTGKLWYGR